MCFICSSVGAEKAGGKGERETKGTGSAEILKPKTEDVCCLPSKYIKVSTCWPVANIRTCVTCVIVFLLWKSCRTSSEVFWEGGGETAGRFTVHANSLFCSVGAYKCYSFSQPFVWV